MNFDKEKRQAITIRLFPSTIDNLKGRYEKYQTQIQNLIEHDTRIDEEYESLEYVARMVAHTIKMSAESDNPREPYFILFDYVNWFLDSYEDDINGELRHIMLKSMGHEFDPLVAYDPLWRVMVNHQDRFKEYDLLYLNDTKLAKLAIRQYIMDYVWSYANPSDDEYDMECSPHFRDDYGDIGDFFISVDSIEKYLFYDIDLKFSNFIEEKYQAGMSIEEIYAKNQNIPQTYGDREFTVRKISMDILKDFLADKNIH